VQQNADITYRLYDYGRPRELHLDEGIAVARARAYARPPLSAACAHDMDLLTAGEAPFLLSQRTGGPGSATLDVSGRGWFVPLSGSGTIDGQDWRAGECWLVNDPATLKIAETACWLIATVPDA
jgi:mannose-6-phosphate isomerase